MPNDDLLRDVEKFFSDKVNRLGPKIGRASCRERVS